MLKHFIIISNPLVGFGTLVLGSKALYVSLAELGGVNSGFPEPFGGLLNNRPCLVD